MDDWGDVRRGVVSSALDSVMVVFVLAATVLFLEVLGPLEYVEDSFIVTVYGDHLSMAQMMYWCVPAVQLPLDFAVRAALSVCSQVLASGPVLPWGLLT